MSSGYVVDPKRALDSDASVTEYHASRARYVRTLTSDLENRLQATIGAQRKLLAEECANLTRLAQNRNDAYQRALRTYSEKVPRRVTSDGLAAPSPLERLNAGVDKLYRAAARAAEEYREVSEMIEKRQAKLEAIDRQMRAELEHFSRALAAQLETPAGREAAFRRDPLLARAHARMQAAGARGEADAIVR